MEAHIEAWIDQEDARLKERIRARGWTIEYIGGGVCTSPWCDGSEDEGPPFAYTVGLFGLGHPELLVFGLSMESTAAVLNGFGDRIHQGHDLVPGLLLTLPGIPHQFVAETVPNPGEIVLGANRFYHRPPGASVPVLQVTYDDGTGAFPWDEGYPYPSSQPRPGTFRA